MQTFIELLRKEFDKQADVKYSSEQLQGIDAFAQFAEKYLAANRPVSVGHTMASNYVISLKNREVFSICPALASKSLPNHVAQVTGTDNSASNLPYSPTAQVTRPKS